MLIEILEKDEEVLWQSTISLKPQKFLIILSLIVLIICIVTYIIIAYGNLFPDISNRDLFLLILTVIDILILSFSGFVILYTLLNLFGYSRIFYYATNKRIIRKVDGKEYNEYNTIDYTNIKYINIRPVLLSFHKNVDVVIFPDFENAGDLDWRVQYFKESDVKVPQRLDPTISRFLLYHISDQRNLFKVLKQNNIKKKKRNF
jgi:hypothetical protein